MNLNFKPYESLAGYGYKLLGAGIAGGQLLSITSVASMTTSEAIMTIGGALGLYIVGDRMHAAEDRRNLIKAQMRTAEAIEEKLPKRFDEQQASLEGALD